MKRTHIVWIALLLFCGCAMPASSAMSSVSCPKNKGAVPPKGCVVRPKPGG